MDDVRKMLDEAVKTRIEGLETLDQGSDEETQAVKNIAVLCEARNADNEKSQKIDRILKYAFEGVTFVCGILAYGHWYRMGLMFEKEGTFTSKTVQNLTKLFKPIKKK